MADKTGFLDPGCADSLRYGSPLLGPLPAAACSEPFEYAKEVPVWSLRQTDKCRNEELLASLKMDEHADFLAEQTMKDHKIGNELNLSELLLGRRFSRRQGLTKEGTIKLRAVDDKSADGTNGLARPTATPKMDGIDALVKCTLLLKKITQCNVASWKTDIDAAYRRVPVRPEDHWAAWITFLHEGQPVAARHKALMSGSVGSVHGWDRVGSLFRHLGRRVLQMALNRWVDDYYSLEMLGTEAHAMQCFARMVRAIMGATAPSESKLESGVKLDVLDMTISYDGAGVKVNVNHKKA